MASPQAFQSFSAPTSPVSNTAGATFANNYAKLSVPNLSTRDVKAIQVQSLATLLHSNNNQLDYRTNHAQLITDAGVFTRGISNFKLHIAQAVTDWNGAFSSDALITTDIAAILKNASDYRQLSEQQLDRIVAYLYMQIGF